MSAVRGGCRCGVRLSLSFLQHHVLFPDHKHFLQHLGESGGWWDGKVCFLPPPWGRRNIHLRLIYGSFETSRSWSFFTQKAIWRVWIESTVVGMILQVVEKEGNQTLGAITHSRGFQAVVLCASTIYWRISGMQNDSGRDPATGHVMQNKNKKTLRWFECATHLPRAKRTLEHWIYRPPCLRPIIAPWKTCYIVFMRCYNGEWCVLAETNAAWCLINFCWVFDGQNEFIRNLICQWCLLLVSGLLSEKQLHDVSEWTLRSQLVNSG